MDIWQILGIAATTDEVLIKQAYRQQLRHCHPEEDPEGFGKLRQAYEQALKSIKSQEESHCQAESPVKSQPQQPATHQESEQLFSEFKAVLMDPSRRFNSEHWSVWHNKIQNSSLSTQLQLSDMVLADIFNWLWLPAPIIDQLWHSLEWQSLLRGNKEQQQQGDYLNWWRSCPTAVPLEWLSQQENSIQRAVQSFYQPLIGALHSGDVAAISQLLYTPGTAILGEHPALAVLQLRVVRALDIHFPAVDLLSLCELVLNQHQISDEDLVLLAQISRRCGKEDLVLKLAQELAKRELHAFVAEHLRHWYLPSNPRLAMWFEALACYRGWSSRAAAMLEEAWLGEAADEDLIGNMLESQVFDYGYVPRTILPLTTLTGYEGALARLWWASNNGSWRQIEQYINLPDCELEESGWQYLGDMLRSVAKEIIATRPEHSVFEKLAEEYGKDSWLTQGAPSSQEMAAPTQQEWLEAYRRHPLLPLSWFKPLHQRAEEQEWHEALIDTGSWAGLLAWQRAATALEKGFDLNPALGEISRDMFCWAEFYYSLCWSPKAHWPIIRTAVEQLSPPLPDTPLMALWQLSADHLNYSKQIDQAVRCWPEQFVLNIELRNQVYLLEQSDISDEALFERFTQQSDPLALGALVSRKIEANDDDIQNTLILWALFRYSEGNEIYRYVSTPQRDALEHQLKKKEIEYQSYLYSDESLIYGLANPDWPERTLPHDVAACLAEKEAKDFAYPAGYCLSLLANDFSATGFDARTIESLQESVPKLTPQRQQTADLLLAALENKLNRMIDSDKAQNPKRFWLPGTGKICFRALLLMVFYYFASSSFGYSNTTELILVGLFVIFNLFLCADICVTRQNIRRSSYYAGWFIFTLGLAMLTLFDYSFWWSAPLLGSHLLAGIVTRAGALRNGWPKAFKNKGYLSLKEIVQ